jgi:colanic acid/amylovoran biosynthesis glycosyltransferase
MPKPIALIYRFKLLPFSETFIQNQAESLEGFEAHYLGLRSISGITTNPDRTTIINSDHSFASKLREQRFKLLGKTSKITTPPAIVHAHFANDGAIVLPFVKRLNLPLIVTCHGFDILHRPQGHKGISQRLYEHRLPQLQQVAKRFIAVSDFLKREMLDRGYPEGKIIRHYIGIDTQKFAPCLNIKREPIVLFTGRLAETKGCEHLIRAMGEIQRSLPEVKLVIIGDGSLRSHLETIAKNTLRNYEFLGAQPAEVVKIWMAKSRIFCVPSIVGSCGDTETFGMVFAEAQAMGLPVVSFACGGIPEAVAHEKTGLLAPMGDRSQLTQHLLTLLRNTELWEQFSHQGMSHVRQNFNLTTQTRKLETIYNELIDLTPDGLRLRSALNTPSPQYSQPSIL